MRDTPLPPRPLQHDHCIRALTCGLLSLAPHLPEPTNSLFPMGNFAITQKYCRELHRPARCLRFRTADRQGTRDSSTLTWYPVTPEVLKEVLHTKSCDFIKLPLVTNGIGNTPGKKGVLFWWRVRNPGWRGSCCCQFSLTRKLRD